MTPFLTDRRAFLRDAGTGLGGIALAALLAEQGLLAADEATPLRPDIAPDAPLAPRKPHFAPKAKRVLAIFCSGRGQPRRHVRLQAGTGRSATASRCRAAEKLVTFQGEKGNLVEAAVDVPAARAERQDGLRPAAEPRGPRRRDVLRPLDDRQEQHARPGREPDEHRVHARRLPEHRARGSATPSAASAGTCRRSSPSPTRAACRRSGRTTGAAPSCRPSSRARAFTADKPIPNLARPAGDLREGRRGHARLPEGCSTTSTSKRTPATRELAARIASYETGRADAAPRRGGGRPVEGDRRRLTTSTAPTTRTRSKAGFARNCLLARRLLERDVRFVQLFNGAYAMGEGVGNWDGHKTLKTQYDDARPDPRPPARGAAHRPEAARAAGRHAGGVGDGVRPDADVPEGRERPGPQPEGLHGLAGRARA